jgi:hypothetical protein
MSETHIHSKDGARRLHGDGASQQETYEAPRLTVIGRVEDLTMGPGTKGSPEATFDHSRF